MSRNFVEAAVGLLQSHADPIAAEPMQRYMKNQFPFLGIKTPLRRELTKRLIQEHGAPQDIEQTALALWALPEREYQCVALDLLVRSKKKLTADHIDLLEQLIVTKSWWDTVDALASHMVGALFRLHPALIGPHTDKWMREGNMWLQRTAILFQLGYKDKTDRELLYSFIRVSLDSKEFFIQKAIGWALREYSKTNAEAVQSFVEQTPLASLSKREALKHIQRTRPLHNR